MGELRIGTSGYSFRDWLGTVYPRGAKSGDFLRHYARLFDAVEINATYYRIPPPAVFEGMLRKVPESFVFVVKVPGTMTHERDRFAESVKPFAEAIRPLCDAGQLGGLLAQFPGSFRPSPEADDHLRRLAEAFAGERSAPLNVEFRHTAWMNDDAMHRLRTLGLGFVNVDLPKLRGLPGPSEIVTSGTAYVRLHGRNARMWWQHPTPSHRYDYLYSEDELDPWIASVDRMRAKSDRAYIFTNNCRLGQSVVTALQMMTRLDQGLPADTAADELFEQTAEDRIAQIRELIQQAKEALGEG